MNKLSTIRVERPRGRPVKLLSSVVEGMHCPHNMPFIRRVNETSSALSAPYGSSGGTASYGYDWYAMKLAEEQEAANGE